MKTLLLLLMLALLGFAESQPADAQSLGTLISVFSEPTGTLSLSPAVWIRPAAATTPVQLVQSDPLDDMANDYAKTQRILMRIRFFQGLIDQTNPSPRVPERRSIFGLTPTGGGQGAILGATVGALLCHASVFDPTAISMGTCLILGAIAGQ